MRSPSPMIVWILSVVASLLAARAGADLTPGVNEMCDGYTASNVARRVDGLSADLELIGAGCAIYGRDLPLLKLAVNYDTKERLHVKIFDPKVERYEVPESILPRPAAASVTAAASDLVFALAEKPFSFTVSRRASGEKLFDTTGNALVFEEQYLHVATNLGRDPNIYGLGEHTETFRLPHNVNRTLFARDVYGVPSNTDLYGVHPVYFEHRAGGTHGVLLTNSNGMDVKMGTDPNGVLKLQYNIIGGIFDFSFVAGPTPNAVAEQYAEIVGRPAMPAFWGLGSHQCRWGYRDWIDVAQVIGNYSAAKIPLETMWTDIDYMSKRWIFTVDPDRFPLAKMQTIVRALHANKQHYVMMIDPAVAYQPYPSFQRAVDMDVLLKHPSGGIYKGVVWPGVSAYPDWQHPNTSAWYAGEFKIFFDPETGVDIDGSWIDMNEPANFCSHPCDDPEAEAAKQGMPPTPPPVRQPSGPVWGFPEHGARRERSVAARGSQFGFNLARAVSNPRQARMRARGDRQMPAKVDYLYPPYSIQHNDPAGIAGHTVRTDIVHADGHVEYDVHSLFGTAMSFATYDAMLARRPGKRPFIITRSTFAGAGRKVGKWLGDNLSTWHHYRNSISGVLQFAAIYQMPLVGADVCGFGDNTTETLCARWTALGAFAPFYRNHNAEASTNQEPYRWEIVASAARKAIDIRYSLLDYIYTAMWRQHTTGTPSVSPLWFAYPNDPATWPLDLQYLYGPSLLVSPVTAENATSVAIYLPNDVWYDYHTLERVAPGATTLHGVAFDEIPLFLKGGSIVPRRRSAGCMTVAAVRERDFELVIVPARDGTAAGELYLDDGESLQQPAITHVVFRYTGGLLAATGTFEYPTSLSIVAITVLTEDGPRTEEVRLGLDGAFEVRV